MTRNSITRTMAAVAVMALLLGACGNSKSGGSAGGPSTTAKAPEAGVGGEANRNKKADITGVPGVTSDKISYTAVGTKTNNPLGTCILDCYVAGIKAYFAYRNSEGGIYGRKLALNSPVDDALGSNQAKALEITSGKDAFGSFQATLAATGWADLDQAGVPTYTWGINATEAANHPHIFSSLTVQCPLCTRHYYSYLAKKAGATKAASIGYGVTENSKQCVQAIDDSFKLYAKGSGVKGVYTNNGLAFGLPNGIAPEVTAMKKAGVQFIATCIDLNAMKTLGQELDRQGMGDVVLMHPNSYDQDFVASNAKIFNGDFVVPQFLPFEASGNNTALPKFKEWMKKQGSKETELAMTGWINATTAYEALLAAGPNFDRDKVTAAMNSMKAYTAGGLIQPIDWTTAHTPYTPDSRNGKPDPCTPAVMVKKGKFVTVASPDKPWLCFDGNPGKWADPTETSFK
jgi:hypothetical protein